jgi:hypothetical protein
VAVIDTEFHYIFLWVITDENEKENQRIVIPVDVYCVLCFLWNLYTLKCRNVSAFSANFRAITYAPCYSIFTISRGERNDISDHLQTKKYNGHIQATSSIAKIISFFKKKCLYLKMNFNVQPQNVRLLITELNTTCDRD